MSEDITELNMVQLRRALQQAALPAAEQIIKLRGFDAAFEVADDLSNWCQWVKGATNAPISDDQRTRLLALDAQLEKMSGSHNAKLWTDDALRSRSEWELIRRAAQEILGLFQWPMTDPDDRGIQLVRPKSDFRV